jgi:hypothetical protein
VIRQDYMIPVFREEFLQYFPGIVV